MLPWLPWLPVPVPAAFLLWDGPLEGAVWTAALAGAVWPAVAQLSLAHPLRDLWRSPRRAPWLAAMLAMPSVHRDGMVATLDDAAVWLVTSVWAIAVALLTVRKMPRAGAVAGAMVVPVVVMLASTIAWTGRGRGALTPSTSQMSWLARWHPEWQPHVWQPHVWQLTPTRALSLDDAPILGIPELPAGEYDLVIEPPGPLAGELTVRLGRQDVPIERWQLDGRPAGFSGLVLRLPVDAHSIAMSGDGAARASVHRMTVRPRVLVGRHQAAWARSAARYGWVVAYALDDNAYLEPGAI